MGMLRLRTETAVSLVFLRPGRRNGLCPGKCTGMGSERDKGKTFLHEGEAGL